MEVRRNHHSNLWISRAIEVCLGLALFVPPFIFGARQAYGQLALAVFVLSAFGFWIVGKIIRWQVSVPLARPEVLLPLAAIGLTVVTWISLPSTLIQTISPGVARLLPEWNTKSVASGQWLVASKDKEQTKNSAGPDKTASIRSSLATSHSSLATSALATSHWPLATSLFAGLH